MSPLVFKRAACYDGWFSLVNMKLLSEKHNTIHNVICTVHKMER